MQSLNIPTQSQRLHASKAADFLSLKKAQVLDQLLGILGSDEAILFSTTRFRRLVRNISRKLVILRGFRGNLDESIAKQIAEIIRKHLCGSGQTEFQARSVSLAAMIHCLDSDSQEVTLSYLHSCLADTDLNDPSTASNLACLISRLNIPACIIDALAVNAKDSSSHVADSSGRDLQESECFSTCICELDFESLLRCQDIKLLRLMLAKHRRLTASKQTSLVNASDSRQGLSHRVSRISSQFKQDPGCDLSYYKLCLLVKFYLDDASALLLYRDIASALRSLEPCRELTFLASTNLDGFLLSRLRAIDKSVNISLLHYRYNEASLADFFLSQSFSAQLFEATDQAAASTTLADAVVIIGATDNINKYHYLQASVHSILSQSWPPAEIRIYIDPATDNSDFKAELLHFRQDLLGKNLISADEDSISVGLPKMYLIFNRRIRGQYFARNHGARSSSCTYFFNQDDDDYSCPERIEMQINALQSGSLVCYGRHIRISESCMVQQDCRQGTFWGDGIASLACPRELVCSNPFLEIKSRGDVEFRNRISVRYGPHAIKNISTTLMLMRGSMGSVSSQFEHTHQLAFDCFYQQIDSGYFF